MIRKQYGRNIQGKLFSKALKLNETSIMVKLMYNPVVSQIFNKQFYRYFLKSFQMNDVDVAEMKADTGIIIKNDCQMLPVSSIGLYISVVYFQSKNKRFGSICRYIPCEAYLSLSGICFISSKRKFLPREEMQGVARKTQQPSVAFLTVKEDKE